MALPHFGGKYTFSFFTCEKCYIEDITVSLRNITNADGLYVKSITLCNRCYTYSQRKEKLIKLQKII